MYIFSILHYKLVTKYGFCKGEKSETKTVLNAVFFCKAMPYTPLLVATSVNSAMKICLACSLCDMKNPMRPKNCFTTDYFDNFFSTKDFNSKKNWLKCFVLHWMTIFFQFLYQCMQGFLCTIGFILDLFSRLFLELNCNFEFLTSKVFKINVNTF